MENIDTINFTINIRDNKTSRMTSSASPYFLPTDVVKVTYLDNLKRFHIIIDTRSYNYYSISHLKNAINICLPTTLLKRKSYNLMNILNSVDIPSGSKDMILNKLNNSSTDKLSILFYDSNSNETKISFNLYQTILKFSQFNERFNIYYLNGGFEKIADKSLVESCTSTPPVSPVYDNKFLSGFKLPSSTPSQQKFISSIKKNNLPKLDINAIMQTKYPINDKSGDDISNINSSTCHIDASFNDNDNDNNEILNNNYKFKFPTNFNRFMYQLPNWLKFLNLPNDEILIYLNRKFNKIEQLEQIRLNSVLSKSSVNHLPNICSPNGLCPGCDQISYKVPKGIEYGFKNRYNNVWPYEHSRVKLTSSNDDYFNANYISNYIATQCPLYDTFEDFWKIIWLNKINIIVCLNNQYSEAHYYNDTFFSESQLQIQNIEKQENNNFVIRKINLTKNNLKQVIYHLEFKDWPDFGVPNNFDSLLNLINFKNQLLVKEILNEKILVHCSAGCGRTGVFITLDMLINKFKNNHDEFWSNDDLIYKLIHFQRTQRISMVQNLEQFIFCYEILLAYLTNYFESHDYKIEREDSIEKISNKSALLQTS